MNKQFMLKANFDRITGHKYFDSALQMAGLAKEFLKEPCPEKIEARRLIQCCIRDTEYAINEIETHADWRIFHQSKLGYMKVRLQRWQKQLEQL